MLAAAILPRVAVGGSGVVASRSVGCAAAAAVADGVTLRPVQRRSLVTNHSDCSPMESSCQDGPDVLAPAENLITWKRGDAVRVRMTDSGLGTIKPVSIMTHLWQSAERVPNQPALVTKINGNCTSYTYEEYYEMTRQAARSFIQLGLEPQSAVGIMGFNSPEWVISSLGAIFAGGLSTGIYTTNSPDACHYVADHARCNVIVVDDDKQLQKILSIRDRLPHLKAIVQYRGQPDKRIQGVFSWSEFMALGSQSAEQELEKRIKAQAPNKCCMLVYTSGTTGNPKGVMLSHDNLVWAAKSIYERVDESSPAIKNERFVSYLPLSHVAAQIMDVFAAIKNDTMLYFAQPDAMKGTLGQTIKEARPTVFLGVPRVYEKMQEAVLAAGADSSALKRRVFAWAREAGLRGNLARMSGQEPPLMSKIADRVILSKVREALGLDKARLCISSAAPISRSTLDFFVSLNLPIVEVLGMSELSGPHTGGIAWNNVVGSVGTDLSGTRTIIHNPNVEGVGEMLMDGRNVCMGYLDMKEQTIETFGGPEGRYLHTGDLARRDERGFLHICGRIKEILITSGGENVPSVPIEDAVKDRISVVSNCMLIGDKRRYLTMLITMKTNVDPDTLMPLNTLTPNVISWCRSLGSSAETVRDVINDVALNNAIQKGIDDVNRKATSNAQRIQKFVILPSDFSVAGGELGPTLKLRRHIVLNKYRSQIDSMYVEPSAETVSIGRRVTRDEAMAPSLTTSNCDI